MSACQLAAQSIDVRPHSGLAGHTQPPLRRQDQPRRGSDLVAWTAAQIAWMAALYEGEGYVCMPRSRSERGGRHSSALRLRFKMCDRDVLEQFKRFAGGGNLSGPQKPSGLGKKVTYTLAIQGPRAYALLVAFWPWLGERRRGQVKAALMKWATMVPTHVGRIITRDEAEQIKRRLEIGGHGIGRQLAREYGVSDVLISRIKMGKAWL